MAAFARVGLRGWSQGDDAAAAARIGVRGWYQIKPAADTTAPTLTSPTFAGTGSTSGAATVSTDESNGTLYCVITQSATSPSAAQVQAGQNHSGAAADWDDSQTITTTGAKNFSPTGLAPATTYYAHFQHRDAAANDSAVSSSAGDATHAGGSGIAGIARFYSQLRGM